MNVFVQSKMKLNKDSAVSSTQAVIQ